MTQRTTEPTTVRSLGIALIAFAIAFNLPYIRLAERFDYPAILRSPPADILAAFTAGGADLIITWALFALAALIFAPVAVGVSIVTRRAGHASSAISALGVAAGVTQAIGLSRWVYAVPALAAAWSENSGDPALRAAVETAFVTLHQFAGVGIGEAIGQSLTAFWLISVAFGQRRHPRFGRGPALLGLAGGIILLLGLVEGLATVIPYDPGMFGLAAPVGFLVLTAWIIWTGICCIRRPAAEA